MKNTKKFAAMIAALTLSACSIAPMAMTASAAPASLTMTAPTNLPEGATIQESVLAYQVFTTKVTGSNTTSDRLMNITGWGSGVNVNGLITEMGWDNENITNDAAGANKVAALITAEGFDLNAFAKAVINNKVGDGTSGTYKDGTVSFTDISNGYYAISCTVKAATGDEHDAQSLGMLTVVDDDATQVGNGEAKIGLPQVMKKVKEDTHTIDGTATFGTGTNAITETEKWNDVADYDIGDAVPFKLYGTLPDDYDKYDTYYYCFNDTLGKEFTAPSDSDIVVKVNGTAITTGFTKTVTAVAGSATSIKIEFSNLKAEGLNITKDSVITVEYDAVLSAAAEVGKPGQENAVNLTYSNNPNKQGEGETGTTPDDKVKVYTYALEIEKTFFNAAGGPITVDELENGTYEQVVFNLSKDGSTLKFSEYDGEGDYDYVVDENGTITELELTEIDVNKDDGDGTDKTKRADNKLVIRIKGLDDGTYTLTESTAPKGFNTAPDQTITITAGTENDQTWDGTDTDETLNKFEWTVGEETKEGNTADALAYTEVQNKKGAELPSTGGMGTTLCYLGGGAMVAVAGVFLITKKRMGKSEN